MRKRIFKILTWVCGITAIVHFAILSVALYLAGMSQWEISDLAGDRLATAFIVALASGAVALFAWLLDADL